MSVSAQSPAAVIQPGSFLTLHYRLAGPRGNIINTFGGAPATLSIGSGELAPALEARLLGLAEGAHVMLDFAPGQVFGARSPDMIQWLPRQELDALGDPQEHYAVGDALQLATPDGQGRFAAVVLAVREDGALRLDFNHPLAGQPVTFEARIIGVL
ncbi:MAG: peptidylprolyl isomerase [Burkholderiaceae bacterium]|jgi:FKBP-type peptidyl-prolyl cis-trans isomerase SlpA|nr:peptidylprolyl isomerase [Burkholderiaceae bacterium]